MVLQINKISTPLYSLSILSREYYIIVYCAIGAPVHGKAVVVGLNTI